MFVGVFIISSFIIPPRFFIVIIRVFVFGNCTGSVNYKRFSLLFLSIKNMKPRFSKVKLNLRLSAGHCGDVAAPPAVQTYKLPAEVLNQE